jgi:hypothetical protein
MIGEVGPRQDRQRHSQPTPLQRREGSVGGASSIGGAGLGRRQANQSAAASSVGGREFSRRPSSAEGESEAASASPAPLPFPTDGGDARHEHRGEQQFQDAGGDLCAELRRRPSGSRRPRLASLETRRRPPSPPTRRATGHASERASRRATRFPRRRASFRSQTQSSGPIEAMLAADQARSLKEGKQRQSMRKAPQVARFRPATESLVRTSHADERGATTGFRGEVAPRSQNCQRAKTASKPKLPASQNCRQAKAVGIAGTAERVSRPTWRASGPLERPPTGRSARGRASS